MLKPIRRLLYSVISLSLCVATIVKIDFTDKLLNQNPLKVSLEVIVGSAVVGIILFFVFGQDQFSLRITM